MIGDLIIFIQISMTKIIIWHFDFILTNLIVYKLMHSTVKWGDFGLLGDFGHFCITFIDLLIKRKNIWNTLFWLYLYFEEIFVTLSSTRKSILRWAPFQKYLFIVFWNTYFNCAEKYYFILKTHDSLLKSGYPRWSPMPYCY